MHAHGPGPGGHIPTLDGLRGLAILGVMLFHQTVMVPASAVDREVARLSVLLASGVDLFFVLSGFLITGILVDSKQAPRYYRNFYARRILRIVPLYYAVLFAALVVLPQFPHPKLAKWGHIQGIDQVWYWLFLSNWSIALGGVRHGMIDLSWTLSIEEQFYLAWPLVVRLLDRRRLMAVCVGLMVLGPAVRLALTLAGAPPIWASMMTPARVDTLAIGAWIALAAREGRGIAGLVPITRRAAVGAAAVVAALYLPREGSGLLEVLKAALGTSALGVLYGAVLVLAVGDRPGGLVARAASNRGLIVLGTYSYALYLFHNPIQAAIRDTVYGPSRFSTVLGSALPGQCLFYAAATAPALVLAWLSWHLFEAPILSLKRFFPSGRDAAGRGARECRPLGLDPSGIEGAAAREAGDPAARSS